MTTEELPDRPSMRADLDALAAFLLDRLAEDEEAARSLLRSGEFLPFESIGQTADHRARHGPLRVLREVAAKRTVVHAWRDSPRAQRDRPAARRPGLTEAMIMAMAAVFADHPDFDPTWLATVCEGGEEPYNVVPLPGS